MERETALGSIVGNERENCFAFLGVPFARAKRFEYATLLDAWPNTIDATKAGPACPQNRIWFPHFENPTQKFYHKEYREGVNYEYNEDCLNLNIYIPKKEGIYPVIVFFHGGGFDSGDANGTAFDGNALAKRGIITVFAQYRVGVFGYYTNPEIQARNGHDGNFGLDDQCKALEWVHRHIQEFQGDPNNITAMGQSAGAMSLQYLCCSKPAKGFFQKAIMMSGAGLFPKFSLPKKHEKTQAYWSQVMTLAGCKTLEEFQRVDAERIFAALEIQKKRYKNNIYYTMPVVDGYLIAEPFEKAIEKAFPIPYLLGVTNNDMYTIMLAFMAEEYAKKHQAYLYYFDIDAKGDDNRAFHSSDVRYMFGTLDASWRPYDHDDRRISELMMDYLANFAKRGDPNGDGLPPWTRGGKKALHLCCGKIEMARIKKAKLLKSTFAWNPK